MSTGTVSVTSLGTVRPAHYLARPVVTVARPAGPIDHLSAAQVLGRLPHLSTWPVDSKARNRRLRGAGTILKWLRGHPGAGWQDRWVAAGADTDAGWIGTLIADDPRSAGEARKEITDGLVSLLHSRLVLPSYGFLSRYHSKKLLTDVRQVFEPDLFARMQQEAAARFGMTQRGVEDGLVVVAKLVLHTGRDPSQITAEDVLGFRAWALDGFGRTRTGTYQAWDMLRVLGILDDVPLRHVLLEGQPSTAELVDSYGIACRPVRDLLIRYLDERRPGVDFTTFRGLASTLAGAFWGDLERRHPGIDNLHLTPDVASAWKERMRLIERPGQAPQPRRSHSDILACVRAFYLDIQEWALEDASWAPWAVPSPVRQGETAVGRKKERKRATAAMHQRVRERLPHLDTLIAAAEQHLAGQAELLRAARACAVDEEFTCNGVRYVRFQFATYRTIRTHRASPDVVVQRSDTGELIDVTRAESRAFWAWAIIETLRHTGVRIEELLEITHLALVSYRLPKTGELVPLLQIVPSKSNEERLLLVSPDLASVLATIVSRLRRDNGGTIPQVARYDPHERVAGPPLPHLFQRKHGHRAAVISPTIAAELISAAISQTSLVNAAGQALHFTPHDFRRIFATEAVTGGLPVHIAARLLGHASLNTTQAYLAVFQEDLVQSYRAFLSQRRALRPAEEYREPTPDEWQEFQQHFELRKVELGTCGRPYAAPCRHEHAPLTELTTMFQQFVACFRLLALTCPRDRIG